jgi:hypothetical protein
MKPGNFLLFGRHDDLAALFKWDAVLRAELNHPADPPYRQAGLRGARFVVKARMQYSAVVSGLMAAGPTLLLKEKQLSCRESLK